MDKCLEAGTVAMKKKFVTEHVFNTSTEKN